MKLKSSAAVVLAVILGGLCFGATFLYGASSGPVAAWIVLWLLSFVLFLGRRGSLQERGATFLIVSVAIGLGGQKYLEIAYGKQFIVEVIAQVFVIIGAGMGANLMSHWLIESEKSDSEIEVAKKAKKKAN